MTRVHDVLPPAPIGGPGGLTAGTGWFAPGAGLAALTSGLGQPPQPIETLGVLLITAATGGPARTGRCSSPTAHHPR
jgi:hypothetical protein